MEQDHGVTVGVRLPTRELNADMSAMRDFVQAGEELGLQFLSTTEHILSADPTGRPGGTWVAGYTHTVPVHEPFVLFSYLAAVTSKIRFATAILVLPLRQTALVAKQAAELDVVSGGRLILGVGVGWNEVEFEAMGVDFKTRAARFEEQITVLRAFWTEDVVDFHGKWHDISRAGIVPKPQQQPIPLWIGGTSDRALDRAGRLADGWFAGASLANPYKKIVSKSRPGQPTAGPGDEDWTPHIERVLASAETAGRSPSEICIANQLNVAQLRDSSELATAIAVKRSRGVTHVVLSTEGAALSWPQGHIDALKKVRGE